MSRDLDSGLATSLSSARAAVVLMAEFDFDSGTVGMWTGYGTLAWGSKTFEGGGELVSISVVNETEDLQAQGVTYMLTGVPSDLISVALTEHLQGRPCRAYIGTVNSVPVAGSPLPQNQLLDVPYQFFAGLMDVIECSDDGQSCTLKLSAENALILVTQARTRYYTDADQQQAYSGDFGLEFLAQLQDKQIIW